MSESTFTSYLESPIGPLKIVTSEDAVLSIEFAKKSGKNPAQKPKILKDCETQLAEYFSGRRHSFDLKLNPDGTPFQKKVWSTLQNIPFGQTASYKEIAHKIKNPKAFRAIGLANNKNPIPIVIPCHRIIGADGSLTGYAGGLKKKSWLIENEK